MKRVLPLILMFIGLNINAQKNIKGKIEDLKSLKSRDLAVVIFEEDVKYTEKLAKKIAKTKKEKKKAKLEKELTGYKNRIEYFNKTVKEVVPALWSLNDVSSVVYFTEKEVKKLQEEKSDKYAVLDLRELEVASSGTHGTFLNFNLNVMTYGPSEKKRNKSTYRNYFISTNYNFPEKPKEKQKEYVVELEKERENEEKIVTKENISVTILLFQKHINKAIELNDKISFQEFAEAEAKSNCSQLEGNKVLLQSAIVNGKILNDLKKHYPKGDIELVSAQRIADAINNSEDVIVGFPVTKQFAKIKGGLGPIGAVKVRPIDHKMLMNAKTKAIVGFAKHSGMLAFRDFKKKDFEKLTKQCK